MSTYIRDLIELPERVHEGDFVLNLSAGVIHPEATLRDYVVTPQLTSCFEDALSFVKSAVEGRTSKAAYLHGSFGAGKSHFMAVLHLLLQHHVPARSIPELQPVIARHTWAEARKFLLVPYHMIGARSMESAILGGYVDFVRRSFPEAPIPAVYPAAEILENARKTRAQMGDERFFAELNRTSGDASKAAGRWGKLEGGWTPESFDRVAAAAPLSEAVISRRTDGASLSSTEEVHVSQSQERSRLIGQLISVFFPAYQGVAAVKDEAYVPLDQGLSIVSQHARDLGFDALVLFLDELVLWLASRAADVAFVHREGQKLAKLVESQRSDRPIPIISFVARQRDLRELVGERLTGAEQLNFADALRHWEGRFHTISLEDRNLATIAQKRVLRPKTEAARQVLSSTFEGLLTTRREVLDVLCTSSGDQEIFRQVYPFTPALVQTLVALSSALQRHRTALKLLLLLLVRQRDTLELGQILPVGDLWDVLDAREKALTAVLESSFKKARLLYSQRIRPVLKAEHQILEDDDRYRQTSDPLLRSRWTAFRNDERLAKTLLLSALVPEVEALKDLTAARLAALNFGSVVSPIPGREPQLVLSKVRSWAAQVGEIRIGEGNNPTLSIKLTGVDTEGLLERVREQDNPGNRQRKVREILFHELDITDGDTWLFERSLVWRGTVRSFDVAYGNVRTFTADAFRNRGERWKVIIDFPFDEAGFTPAFDKAKVDEFRRSHPDGALTVVWLPRFLSVKAQQDLGTLVLLDYLLTGDNFDRNAAHLAPVERAEARALIANQRSALHIRVKQHLEAAYGIAAPKSDALDLSHELEEPFNSLRPMFSPRVPGVGSLKDALEGVLDQALTTQYPAHPRFNEEVKLGALRKTLEVVQQAARADQQRVPVDRALRKTIESIAHPLKLGQMAETHFVLSTGWRDRLNRWVSEEKLETVTAKKVRASLDPESEPSGITREVANLILLTWAEQTNRLFFLHGGPVSPTLDKLEDEVELREQRLPSAEEWRTALPRSEALLGVTASPLLNATNVATWATDLRTALEKVREAALDLPGQLRYHAGLIGIRDVDMAQWPRVATANEAVSLIGVLKVKDDVALVTALAKFAPSRTLEALARSLSSSEEVITSLKGTTWQLISAAGKLTDERRLAGEMLVQDVVAALTPDELAQPLHSKLAEACGRALKLLTTETPEEQEKKRAEEEEKRREEEQRRKRDQEALERQEKAQLERKRLEKELEDKARQEKELRERLDRERRERKRLEREWEEKERARKNREEKEREEKARELRRQEEEERLGREAQALQEKEARERREIDHKNGIKKQGVIHVVGPSGDAIVPAGDCVVHSQNDVVDALGELEILLERHPGSGIRLMWLVEED